MNSYRWRRLVLGVALVLVVGRAQAADLQARAPKELLLDLGGVKLEMVWIPAGKFLMGSPAGEEERDKAEVQHEVTLTQAFWMGRYEVTQEQYLKVMGKNPSKVEGPRQPEERMTFDEAQEFCRKASALAGRVLRLPTEAEWEYACRAGTTTPFYTGATAGDLERVAWYSANSRRQPHPVGAKEPNAWGLYDMHGNIQEWCQDWYGELASTPATDPQGPAKGDNRVARGGSFSGRGPACRSATRGYSPPDFFGLGLRVVSTDAPQKP